jgi:hypothetical protein
MNPLLWLKGISIEALLCQRKVTKTKDVYLQKKMLIWWGRSELGGVVHR